MTAIVYGKDQCKFCKDALKVLEGMGVAVDYRDVTVGNNLELLREQLPAVKTVPQIWIGDLYVGGFDGLVEHLRSSVAAKPTPAENWDGDYGQGAF